MMTKIRYFIKLEALVFVMFLVYELKKTFLI